MDNYVTVQELYDWAKEHGYLNKRIAKFYNFSIKDIDDVEYMSADGLSWIGKTIYEDGRVVLD